MKALLVEDHPLVLSGLRFVLRELGDDLDIACVDSTQAARATLAAELSIGLVVLDLDLRGCGGFSFLEELRVSYPSTSIMALSSSDANVDVVRAIHCGAMGYVPKRASNEVLVGALRMVMAGSIFVPPMSLRSGTGRPSHDSNSLASHHDDLVTRRTAAALGLTPRQTDVLQLLLEGRSNKVIARALNVSVDTIKDHVAAVLRTLNVTSRTQAVVAMTKRPLSAMSFSPATGATHPRWRTPLTGGDGGMLAHRASGKISGLPNESSQASFPTTHQRYP